jgi:hypothetical protein
VAARILKTWWIEAVFFKFSPVGRVY